MLNLQTILRKFSNPKLGLVRHDNDGKTGVHGALLDALGDDPCLALQLRQRGYRAPLAGIVDCPESILDVLADDIEVSGAQAAALLTGEVDGVILDAPILRRLLCYVPDLPLASVAAIESPTDLARRPFVTAWLERAVSTGQLPAHTLRGVAHVNRQNYADIANDGSALVSAWTGRIAPQNAESN